MFRFCYWQIHRIAYATVICKLLFLHQIPLSNHHQDQKSSGPFPPNFRTKGLRGRWWVLSPSLWLELPLLLNAFGLSFWLSWFPHYLNPKRRFRYYLFSGPDDFPAWRGLGLQSLEVCFLRLASWLRYQTLSGIAFLISWAVGRFFGLPFLGL